MHQRKVPETHQPTVMATVPVLHMQNFLFLQKLDSYKWGYRDF